MDSRAPSMLKPTLIGGVAFGIASAIPILNFANCLCCSLVIASGFLAAFLYSKECRNAGAEFRAGGGALVGLVAGLFYALASTVVSALMPKPDPEEMIEMMEQFNVPPESIDMMSRFMEGSSGVMGILIGFFVTLLIAAIFSTLGGLIGGAVFKVLPPEAPPADPTGTAPPPPPAP